MLTDYLRRALHLATYEHLEQDRVFYGEIPGFQGVFATGKTLEGCREQLAEVLEDWVLVRVSRHLELPEVDGIRLMVREVG